MDGSVTYSVRYSDVNKKNNGYGLKALRVNRPFNLTL